MSGGGRSAIVVLILGLVGGVALVATSASDEVLLMTAAVAFVVVGAIVLGRADGNRVGWILTLIGLAMMGSGVAGELTDGGAAVAGGVGGALWLIWFVLAGFLLLWFPTGQRPSSRWRVVEWIGVVAMVHSLSYVVTDRLCLDWVSDDKGVCSTWVDNPIGIPGVPNPEYGPLGDWGLGLLAAFLLLAVSSLVVRYVRSAVEVRLQLKWLLSAASLLTGLVALEEAFGSGLPLPTVVWDLAFGTVVVALPVSIGVAILRYRLYDIERIISRTLGYVLVVSVLALLYTVGAVWLPSRLVGEQPPVFVAGATLAAAALFNPLRRRILDLVDHRFYRSRYNPAVVVDGLAVRLRDQVDPDRLIDDWVGTVTKTMQPSTVGVWVREGR